MINKIQKRTKWFFLVVGLLFIQQSFAEYKNLLTDPVNGQESTDERIEEGSQLFAAKCAACHSLKKKVVGPALDGVREKYNDDEWVHSWIKDNSKLIAAGDERALKIFSEYNEMPMSTFADMSDDEITSILMWIGNGGDGVVEEKADAGPVVAPVSDSLFGNINRALIIMGILIFVILLMVFGIMELMSNLSGRNIINWNNINAYMMIIFLIGFFGLSIYEYIIHAPYLLPESASEHGIGMDEMMKWTWIATLPVFFITQFLLFYFSFRYRQKPGRKAYFLSHNNNLEYVWTLIPAIVLATLVSGGFKMWNEILRSDSADQATHIEVFAYQFGWTARYAGTDGELGKANYNLINSVNPLGVANRTHAEALIVELDTNISQLERSILGLSKKEAKLRSTLGGMVGMERNKRLRDIKKISSGDTKHDLELTIRARHTQIERLTKALEVQTGNMFTGAGDDDLVTQEIHLVKDKPVTLKFRARDVIHSAYLPYFRTQMNVVPGLPTEFTFTPIISTSEMRGIKKDKEFDYYIVCNKICGNAHFNMKMKVIVEDQKSYDKWLNSQTVLFTKKKEQKPESKDDAAEESETEAVALN